MPSLIDVISYSGGVLVSLGGGAGIVKVAAEYFGKRWAEKMMIVEKAKHDRALAEFRKKVELDLEQYKVQLKKSTFIFEKEYEAASELVKIKEGLLPSLSHPDMDWSEACDLIAGQFDDLELMLINYMKTHGAVLDLETRKHLNHAIAVAANGKFNLPGNDPHKTGNDFWESLKAAHDQMIRVVKGQAKT